MAEGGNQGQGENGNPYSFQHFVVKPSHKTTKHTDSSPEERSTKNEFFEPDIGIPTRREINKLVVADDEKCNKREENPFSLKQFLKKDLGAKPKNKVKPECEMNGIVYDPCSKIEPSTTSKLANFASGLPDFVQDHFFVDQSLRENNEERFCENKSPSPAEINCADTDSIMKNRPNGRNVGDAIVSSSLPDFLSDGPMLNNHIDHYQSQNETSPLEFEPSNLVHTDHTNEVATLRAENDRLKQQIQQINQIVLNKTSKIQELQDEVKSLKARENEETNALEKVVQQVEHNLQSTIKRAVTAESLVAKQKQEIKTLQSRLNGASASNYSCYSEESQLNVVREKANMASQQIQTAAQNAEQTIRQLLMGVESLKLVASCLHNIDKVTDSEGNFNQADYQ